MINEAKEGRITQFDFLKGLSAWLVVLGHIVTGKEEYHWLYNFIYSFHMPLFMFLAGCTAVISYRNSERGGGKLSGAEVCEHYCSVPCLDDLFSLDRCRNIWQCKLE